MGHKTHPLALPEVVPVFPLPNTVFFPNTVLPLHIFEPRYRAMVRDARDGDGMIVVALAQEGDFHRIGTVGRIRDVTPRADGRFDIQLEGLVRVALTEVPSNRPYRLVRLEPRPEHEVEDRPEIERAKLDLLATLGYLRSELTEGLKQPIVLDERLPLRVAVNIVCAGLPVDAAERQALLETDDLLERQRSASEQMQRVLELVLRHKSRRGAGAEQLLN